MPYLPNSNTGPVEPGDGRPPSAGGTADESGLQPVIRPTSLDPGLRRHSPRSDRATEQARNLSPQCRLAEGMSLPSTRTVDAPKDLGPDLWRRNPQQVVLEANPAFMRGTIS